MLLCALYGWRILLFILSLLMLNLIILIIKI